eukprot:1088750-Pleurochrysis_carterae.AAC.1
MAWLVLRSKDQPGELARSQEYRLQPSFDTRKRSYPFNSKGKLPQSPMTASMKRSLKVLCVAERQRGGMPYRQSQKATTTCRLGWIERALRSPSTNSCCLEPGPRCGPPTPSSSHISIHNVSNRCPKSTFVHKPTTKSNPLYSLNCDRHSMAAISTRAVTRKIQ